MPFRSTTFGSIILGVSILTNFCLLVLSITEKDGLKFETVAMDFVISPFNSILFA